ncbi:transposable element Tcb1 transposase [Trichonephila clavipes]|nr:transposable element Tcb1 transposase [Trichonephila clavipes]
MTEVNSTFLEVIAVAPFGESRTPFWIQKNLRSTVKHGGGSVMVWGCMASNGVGNLVFIDGIMDPKLYIDILNNNLKESAKELGLDGNFIFQQDNDSKHTADTLCCPEAGGPTNLEQPTLNHVQSDTMASAVLAVPTRALQGTNRGSGPAMKESENDVGSLEQLLLYADEHYLAENCPWETI